MDVFEKFFIGDGYQLNFGYIETIPELMKLKGCEQTPRWHKEGNAWNHTLLVTDQMKKQIGNETDINTARLLMMAALFHDIGKGETTEFKNGDWHSYNHDVVGEKIARRVLWNEGIPNRERVCKLIRMHMEIAGFRKAKDAIGKCARIVANMMVSIYSEVACDWFIKLIKADEYGSISDEESREKDLELIGRMESIMLPLSNLYWSPEIRRNIFHNEQIDKSLEGLPVVTVMVGLPGSGKNTYIERFLPDRTDVLSRDDIRAELGMCGQGEKFVGTREQEEVVTRIFDMRLEELAKEGKDIVINNINLVRKYRDELRKKLNAYDYAFHYVYCEAPTIEDNFRRRRGMISEDTILAMTEKFDFPTCDEYDYLRYYISG